MENQVIVLDDDDAESTGRAESLGCLAPVRIRKSGGKSMRPFRRPNKRGAQKTSTTASSPHSAGEMDGDADAGPERDQLICSQPHLATHTHPHTGGIDTDASRDELLSTYQKEISTQHQTIGLMQIQSHRQARDLEECRKKLGEANQKLAEACKERDDRGWQLLALSRENEQLKKEARTQKEASSMTANSTGLMSVQSCYLALIGGACSAYSAKANALMSKTSGSSTPTHAEASNAPLQKDRVRIIQKNAELNTEREIKFLGAAHKKTVGWYYDSSTPPTPSNPAWSQITDQAIISQLVTLGDATQSSLGMTDFSPRVGARCRFRNGTYTYNVAVVDDTRPDANAMLFSGSFFTFAKNYILELLGTHEFEAPKRIVDRASIVADMARQFSSYSLRFDYDPNKCQLWLDPSCLKTWLKTASEQGFSECRICMHGMQSQRYDLIAKYGFDPKFASPSSYHGPALYLAGVDAIAADYNAKSNMKDFPNGSAVIGLLLTKEDANYIHYNMTSKRGHYPSRTLNAFAVKDYNLFLPIGLAHAAR